MLMRYWAVDIDEEHDHKVRPTITTYKYYNYTSVYIHHATINDLEYNTKYFYEIRSGDAMRRFFFTTPPMASPDAPYIFNIIGNLGETYDSNQMFVHYYSNSKGQAVLFVGDLSYADNHSFHDNRKWNQSGTLEDTLLIRSGSSDSS
ncbi:purple acid phosphatase 2 [Cucumis sativus]|nr:purple acid phosphatase 2 [Cucumis sativus]KAE8649451.1 hypothetical protein Csa_018888 [Cucumis sativus]